MKLTVVIPTFRRPVLLERCLQSVFAQTEAVFEIFVVDDCSPDRDSEEVCRQFPGVRCFRQQQNRGPGPARNLAMQFAQGEWVLPLDDDDELLPDAAATIRRCAVELAQQSPTPWSVMQFAVYGSSMASTLQTMSVNDYIHERLPGECKPVLHRERFLASGFRYPEIRIGGENLLWWEVAQQFGIPTWQTSIMRYNDDAGSARLTSFDNQVKRAAEYAHLQELMLERFGDLLQQRAPEMLHKKRLGAAIYWMLAGDHLRSQHHFRQLKVSPYSALSAARRLLPWIPAPLIRKAFLVYRDLTAGRARRRAQAAA